MNTQVTFASASLALILACGSAPASNVLAEAPATVISHSEPEPEQNKKTTMQDGLYAHIKTTKGTIVLNLEYAKTPITVANFVALAEGKHPSVSAEYKGKPYYDGILFHRVIADFMVQGGDPTGTGRGGPGFVFPDEIVPGLRHDKPGIFSMANAGPGTNGSQFFITHVPTAWLDGKHTVFGNVVTGQDVVNAIAQGDKIEKVTIEAVGKDAKAFNAEQVLTAAKGKFTNR